jgi:hypothetical protein
MLATNEREYSRMDTRYGNSLTDFSRDLLLRDGAMLRFRALRPGDRGALKYLLSRCSPDSIRYETEKKRGRCESDPAFLLMAAVRTAGCFGYSNPWVWKT